MKKALILSVILFSCCATYAQQDSKVDLSSSSRNKVIVDQEGGRSSQSSTIKMTKSHGNNIHIKQINGDVINGKVVVHRESKDTGLQTAEKVNTALGIVASLLTIAMYFL
jgi:hypothetical protein